MIEPTPIMHVSLLGLVKMLDTIPDSTVAIRRTGKNHPGHSHLLIVKVLFHKIDGNATCLYDFHKMAVVYASQAIRPALLKAIEISKDTSGPFWQNLNADVPDYVDAP